LVIVGGTAGFAEGSKTLSAEERELLAAVRESGVREHVTFTGRIPHLEVKEMYALADVVAYPRRLTRTTSLTTPLKPLEAMAMAKAVIVSDLPPMRELVSDGLTGLVFREGDVRDLAAKCTKLLRDAGLRDRLGSGAREWVLRERQWKALISGYRNVYESVIRGSVHVAERGPKVEARVSAGVGK
jgi:glycosyltransferase involved in cell wall biosynthesis